MTENASRVFAAAALAILLTGVINSASSAQDTPARVNCYNETLGTVRTTSAAGCDGRSVTDSEAAAIRAERRDYIQRVLAKAPNSKMAGRRLTGLGSGFFVAADGSVVTSNHVVEDCAAVSVTPTFGEMVIATSIAADKAVDIALLRTGISSPGVAPIVPSDGLSVMGPAFIAGYPDQGLVTIIPVLTAVEVLRQETKTFVGPALVVRGDVRRGNSGGPLLDSGGSVIGVVAAKVDSVTVYKTTGENLREIGLALPGKVLEDFLDTQGVHYRTVNRKAPQPADVILEDARPFMTQVGCWK
jgi:S1-C subfamily serine protease